VGRPFQDPEIRKKEILDAAEYLFSISGYQQTLISDIVKKIGVAKGTFYYYFSSKEELIEALIKRHLSNFSSEMENMVSSESILPNRKLELMVTLICKAARVKDGLLLDYLYNDQYRHLIDKFFRQAKKTLVPFLLCIIEEGNFKKVFKVDQPVVAVNYILAILQCFFECIYNKVPMEMISVSLLYVQKLFEKMLGLDDGSLDFDWKS